MDAATDTSKETRRMLVLTCPIGGVVRLGQDVQITIAARVGQRVAVSLLAPLAQPVTLARACLQPLVRGDGSGAYLFSLQGVRGFRVGQIEIGVWLPGEYAPQLASCTDLIHLGIQAPGPLRVTYADAEGSQVPVVRCLPVATIGASA